MELQSTYKIYTHISCKQLWICFRGNTATNWSGDSDTNSINFGGNHKPVSTCDFFSFGHIKDHTGLASILTA